MADAGAVSALFTHPNESDRIIEADGHLIAPPGDLRHPEPIDRYAGTETDQVFIGSCMGGRLTDLRTAARILKEGMAKARLIISPISMEAYLNAMKDGTCEILRSAGAVILNPSCGTCAGIDKGMLAKDEKGVFTTTRNARGRHGGRVFSASPEVAALTALLGRISSEEELHAYG